MKHGTIFLLGPTASGKTEVALHLAKKINAEIISADSRQIYRGMDIGTAKPTKEQQKEIPHHLIDIVNPDEDFTVHDFVTLARQKISEIQNSESKIQSPKPSPQPPAPCLPLIVGGTGFYIRALLGGVTPASVPPQKEFRAALKKEAEEKGAQALHKKLLDADPDEAQKIHPNDVKKIIRALEIVYMSGKPKSFFKEKKENEDTLPVRANIFGLSVPREILYARINRRVDTMIKAGLVDEVKRLLSAGYDEACNPMTGIGYRQIIGYLKETYALEDAAELIKRDTRRFAKRQLTYFKLISDIQWISTEGKSPLEIAEEIHHNHNLFPL